MNTEPITLKTATLDGERIAYCTDTEFLVKVGRDTTKSRGSYKTKYRFVGNLGQAVMRYNAINVGNGYKKRLLMPSSKNPVLARQFSS